MPKIKDHRKHMCMLEEEGLQHWIHYLSDKPVVECRYCGAKANSLRNVCAVRLRGLTREDAVPEGGENYPIRQYHGETGMALFGAGHGANRHR